MPVKIIPPTPSAYVYPLLIKHLLHTPMVRSPDQEIVYRDLRRRTFHEFRERVGRLASGLSKIGVEQGDVVAIVEWDSDRYHECYFAIPMMGAVMQTVNVSLTPDDIAYTINDTGATTVLFNADFLPLLEKLKDHLKAVKTYVLMHDRPDPPQTDFPINCEYEALLSLGSPYFPFPDFDENAWATVFHTTGTTGRPKGVTFSHRQLVLHTLAGLVEYGLAPSHGRFHRDDVYMPMTPMFHVHAWGTPYTATGVRRAAVIAIKDIKWGERPFALVILEPDHVGKIVEDDIRLHVASYVERGLISKIAIPENIMFTEDLPLTSVGKVDKKKLRQSYL